MQAKKEVEVGSVESSCSKESTASGVVRRWLYMVILPKVELLRISSIVIIRVAIL